MHCLTAWGQWAVELLQCTASLPGGSGQCNSCNALPHRLGVLGSGTPAMRGPTSWGDGESCQGGGGGRKSGPPAMHCHTAWAQWAVELLQCTAGVVWCGVVWCGVVCRRRWYQMAMAGMPCIQEMQTGGCVSKRALCVVCCTPVAEGRQSPRGRAAIVQGCLGEALPLCLMVPLKFSLGLGLCGSTPWSRRDEAGTWAAEILQHAATLCRVVGSEDHSVYCHTVVGGELWNSLCTLPHSLGAMGNRTPSVHCLAAPGQ